MGYFPGLVDSLLQKLPFFFLPADFSPSQRANQFKSDVLFEEALGAFPKAL